MSDAITNVALFLGKHLEPILLAELLVEIKTRAEKTEKQARAEVLAAVLAKMDGPKMNHANLYRAIQELQPAAKALEELLREEWNKALDAVKERRREHNQYRGDGSTESVRTIIPLWLLGTEEEAIDSLRKEKARVISEEKPCTNGQPG